MRRFVGSSTLRPSEEPLTLMRGTCALIVLLSLQAWSAPPLATPHDVLVDDLADSEEETRPQGLLKRRQRREALDLGAPHQKHGKERPANDLWVALDHAGVGVLALEGAAVGKGLDGETLGAGREVARRERTKSDVKTSKRPDMLTGFWLSAEVTSLGTNLVREEVARALLQRSQL